MPRPGGSGGGGGGGATTLHSPSPLSLTSQPQSSSQLSSSNSTVSSSSSYNYGGGSSGIPPPLGQNDSDFEDGPDWRGLLKPEELAKLNKKEQKRQDVLNGELITKKRNQNIFRRQPLNCSYFLFFAWISKV